MNDLKGIIEDCNKSDLVSDKLIKKIIEIIGQEEWQDLYDENNNICTTMGELIITLKGIPDLEWQLQEVVKDNDNFQAENKKLEQQIEKMKCCENCKHKKGEVDRCELLMYSMNDCLCKNKDKWELKEIEK